MNEPATPVSKKRQLVFLGLSILAFAFWFITKLVNVYATPIPGALYELLALPVLALMLLLLIVSGWYWRKEKFRWQSIHLYSLLILLATIGVIMI